jgi:hypothetical protein
MSAGTFSLRFPLTRALRLRSRPARRNEPSLARAGGGGVASPGAWAENTLATFGIFCAVPDSFAVPTLLYALLVRLRVAVIACVLVALAAVGSVAYAHHNSKSRHQCFFVIGQAGAGVFVQSTHAPCESLARQYQQYAIRYAANGKVPRGDKVFCRMSHGPDGDTGTIYDTADVANQGSGLAVCEDLAHNHGWQRQLGP